MKKHVLLAFVGLSLLVIGCTHHHPISFYHWRTGFAPTGLEREYLTQVPSSKVYIKAFNLSWDAFTNSERQHTVMKMKPDSLKFMDEVVLSVFITDETFLNMPEIQLEAMAARTAFLLDRTIKMFAKNSAVKVKALQIDCDWSAKSRDKYFAFLEAMRKEGANIGLTELYATIHARHVIDTETLGVPPVDQAALIFYNMGTEEEITTNVSILNASFDKSYLKALSEYPLHLDLILPLSGWGVQYRDGYAVDLMTNLSIERLMTSNCCKASENNVFEVDSGMYVDYTAVYKGDKIQVKTISRDQVKKAAARLLDKMPDDARVIYFHLDNSLLKKSSLQSLQDFSK
jgi:hypothetical protein